MTPPHPTLQIPLQAVALSASGEERLLAPGTHDRRTRFVASLALVLAVHALALLWFFHRDAAEPKQLAQAAETPVEVIQEPPQPPPQQQQQPPQTKPLTLDEKPAESAPRAAPKQAADAKTRDTQTQGPKAPMPPRDGQPTKNAETAASAETTTKSASEGKLEDDRRDAEALDKAKAEEGKTAAAARQAAAAEEAPTYRFAADSKMSEFPAGDEDNRYLSIVYAKVMSKNRYRASAAARRGLRGVVSVSFVVDFMGRVPHQEVSQSSGHPDLDALAMAAVRTAAPFPSPPGSGSQQLVARMQFGPDAGPPASSP